jgi:hypothetical protein
VASLNITYSKATAANSVQRSCIPEHSERALAFLNLKKLLTPVTTKGKDSRNLII